MVKRDKIALANFGSYKRVVQVHAIVQVTNPKYVTILFVFWFKKIKHITTHEQYTQLCSLFLGIFVTKKNDLWSERVCVLMVEYSVIESVYIKYHRANIAVVLVAALYVGLVRVKMSIQNAKRRVM